MLNGFILKIYITGEHQPLVQESVSLVHHMSHIH